MASLKDVIGITGRKIVTSIATEAGDRAQAVRRSFAFRRPESGWLRFLVWLLCVCLRGWIYIVAIILLVGWFMYDQPPGEMLELFKAMGAR